jgi:hypothetical protein
MAMYEFNSYLPQHGYDKGSASDRKDRDTQKTWLIAEGFQPVGKSDNVAQATTIGLPSKLFVEATSSEVDLFLLSDDCKILASSTMKVKKKSNKNTDVFQAPHVLVSKGFTSIAFADFDVSFRHALRGISGPKADRELLIFLAAYLRSSLAQYYLFQTSSNWGVSRQEVHVEELLNDRGTSSKRWPSKSLSRVVKQQGTS